MKPLMPRVFPRPGALLLLLSGIALLMPAAAGAHVIWTNPAPRAASLPTDTQAPCGNRLQATPGTSPSRYQPGAEIGLFFREDHGHTLNFSSARAFFTISFSPGGAAGFTELLRMPISSAPVPRLYGSSVVGGPGYVSVKLPTTPTQQAVLQLVYNTTDGTDNQYSCADIQIAALPTPPPPPIDAILEPGFLGDVFEIRLGTNNRGTALLTGLTSLMPGGLRITTDAYPADKRADVGVLTGPAPDIGGTLAPGERRDHLFLLEARSPGFAIAAAQVSAKDPAGKLHEDTALAEIEIQRRVPTLLDLWAMGTGGLTQIFQGAQRDFARASTEMTAAFYRSLPRWKIE